LKLSRKKAALYKAAFLCFFVFPSCISDKIYITSKETASRLKEEGNHLKKRIAIIGSGTAGLQLAYALREEFEVKVFHWRSADEIKSGRVMSTQVHFGTTRERERRFNMPVWNEQSLIKSIHINLGDQKLFTGLLNEPALSVDQRLYFSTCLNDLTHKGVSFTLQKIDSNTPLPFMDDVDLVIDCTGKAGPLFPFPIEKEQSPFRMPKRKCIVGYFSGIAPLNPQGIGVTVIPELGEMFEIPAVTETGPVTILFMMPLPNRPLDLFQGIKTPQDFTQKMFETVYSFFPDIYARINEATFSLCDKQGFLQTAITPVIRKPYTIYQDTLVLGCGDSVFLNDPITGQGCNLASYCAEQLYEILIDYKDSTWNEKLGETYWEQTKPFVTQVTEWTNAMTDPLPSHIVGMLLEGAKNQQIANQIAEWFANPVSAHQAFFSKTTS
jgi:hypothetical protein